MPDSQASRAKSKRKLDIHMNELGQEANDQKSRQFQLKAGLVRPEREEAKKEHHSACVVREASIERGGPPDSRRAERNVVFERYNHAKTLEHTPLMISSTPASKKYSDNDKRDKDHFQEKKLVNEMVTDQCKILKME